MLITLPISYVNTMPIPKAIFVGKQVSHPFLDPLLSNSVVTLTDHNGFSVHLQPLKLLT